jgi:hypothetical protein
VKVAVGLNVEVAVIIDGQCQQSPYVWLVLWLDVWGAPVDGRSVPVTIES